MKHFKIPSKFSILGIEHKVIFDEDVCKKASAYGLFVSNPKTVYLTKKLWYDNETFALLNDDAIAQTFWHEIVHAILKAMNEDELFENEKFVDIFAGMIYQVIKSSEYENVEIKRKPRSSNSRRTSGNRSVSKNSKKTEKKR